MMDFDRAQQWSGWGGLLIVFLGIAALGFFSTGVRESTGRRKRKGRKVVKRIDGKQYREYPKAFRTKGAAQTFADLRRKDSKRARVIPGRIGKETLYFVLIG